MHTHPSHTGAQCPPSNYVAICMIEGHGVQSRLGDRGAKAHDKNDESFCWQKFSSRVRCQEEGIGMMTWWCFILLLLSCFRAAFAE